MSKTLLSFPRAALRLSRFAVAGVAFVAACDDNQPAAPKPPTIPATAKAAVISPKTGSLVMKVFDEKQALITTSPATFNVVGPNSATWTLRDGFVNDSDPTVGVSLLTGLTPGLYQVCETEAPVDYAIAKPACGSVTIYANATSGLYLVNPHLPKITVKTVDFVPNPVPWATFTVKDSSNVYQTIIQDNDGIDLDKTFGTVTMQLPFEGKYTLCQAGPPPGYAYPVAQIKFCFDFTVKNAEVKQVATFTVYPIASAYWQVTDGTININNFYNLIGPSSFKVYAANQTWTDVTDNGLNDIDPTLGKVAVKLPVAGSYQICETTPVPNHWNANPACKPITVATGVPAWAEWFINYEKQVFHR